MACSLVPTQLTRVTWSTPRHLPAVVPHLPFWRKFVQRLHRIRPATAITPSIATCHAEMPATAPTTALALAAGNPCSSHFSGILTETQAATRRTLRDYIHRAWRRWQTSADTNCQKPAPIPASAACSVDGKTPPVKRTATSAPGHLMSLWSPSPAASRNGKSRVSGPMQRSPPTLVIPTALASTVA